MKIRSGSVALAIVLLFAVTAIEAHHSISMFRIGEPVWVKGTVVSYRAINPHAIIALEETISNGVTRQWIVEGPHLGRLANMNLDSNFLHPGDVIEVCGFPPKAEFTSELRAADEPSYPPEAMHGHLLLTPEGQMQPWGPYGKMENCIRPGDEVQTWVDFLDADPIARSLWCGSRRFVNVASLPAPAFVDEIDRGLAEPCQAR